MTRRGLVFLCITVVLIGTAACQKLQDARPFSSSIRGDLPIEHAKFTDAVPAEYGDLIGVTSNADYPTWSQAWFMRPDKSIAVLWINSSTGKIIDHVLLIPRR